MPDKKQLPALLVCFVVTTIFAVHYLAAKEVLSSGISPILLAATRGFFGGLIILVAFYKKIKLDILKKYWKGLLVIGILGFGLNQILFMNGLKMSTALYAAIIGNTIPIVVLIFSAMFKIEKLNPYRIGGILLAFSLLTFSILFEKGVGNESNAISLGNFLIFLNVVSFSLAFVLSKKMLKEDFPHELLSGFMLFIGGAILMVVAIPQFPIMISYMKGGANPFFLIIFEVFVSTALVYFLNMWTIKKLDISVASFFIYFQPIITAIGAFVFLQQIPSFLSFVVFIGIFFSGLLVLKK